MTPNEAVAELDRAITVLGELPGDMIDAAVPAAKTAILDHVSAARGGLTLSGMGATLGIDDTVEEGDTTASAKLTATPAGPWAIVESGTKAHEQNRRGSKAVGSRAMPTPYGYKSRVAHPGSAGQGVWTPATAAADTVVEQAIRTRAEAELPSHG